MKILFSPLAISLIALYTLTPFPVQAKQLEIGISAGILVLNKPRFSGPLASMGSSESDINPNAAYIYTALLRRRAGNWQLGCGVDILSLSVKQTYPFFRNPGPHSGPSFLDITIYTGAPAICPSIFVNRLVVQKTGYLHFGASIGAYINAASKSNTEFHYYYPAKGAPMVGGELGYTRYVGKHLCADIKMQFKHTQLDYGSKVDIPTGHTVVTETYMPLMIGLTYRI